MFVPDAFYDPVDCRCSLNPTEIGNFDSVQASQKFGLKQKKQ